MIPVPYRFSKKHPFISLTLLSEHSAFKILTRKKNAMKVFLKKTLSKNALKIIGLPCNISKAHYHQWYATTVWESLTQKAMLYARTDWPGEMSSTLMPFKDRHFESPNKMIA